jgi:RNA polymerase sigma factor (TIGR02999 family)
MPSVTRILNAIEQGDGQASEQLLPLVYDELRKLAAAKLANEKPGQTLQATALVHEAYIRLVDQTTPQQWDNSRHFFSAAAESMRRILVDRARQKQSLKRGGDRNRVELEATEPVILPIACDDIGSERLPSRTRSVTSTKTWIENRSYDVPGHNK